MNVGIFSIMDRRVSDWFLLFPEKNKHFGGMRAFVGFRQSTITYERASRIEGQGKNLFTLFRMGANAFFAFSMFPLRAAGFQLIFATLWGIALLLESIASIFFENYVPQFTTHQEIFFLVATIFLLFGLAVLTEYIGRMYEMSRGRPEFIFDSITTAGITKTIFPVSSRIGENSD